MRSNSRAAPGRAAARLDGERSRERILDAAEPLLAERGFSGTGIAAISRESGLPASSIYWFFSSKEDLTAAVIERAAERWLDALTESREASPDAEADLHHFLERALAQSGSRLPDFLRLQMLLSLEGGEPRPDLLERLHRMRERARRLVAASIARSLAPSHGATAMSVAEDVSLLAMALANGALLFRHMEPDGIDVDRLAGDLEVAILAVARQRLSEGDS
jgi:AcrR family transcriptional regulator